MNDFTKKPQKTTVAISGETATKLEKYCRDNNILRKDFVKMALDYFERTGFDLQSNAIDYSPVEKIVNDLTGIKDTMLVSKEQNDNLFKLMQTLHEFNFVSKNLPAPKEIERRVAAEKDREACEEHNNFLKEEIKKLKQWKQEAINEFNRISNEQKTFGKIKVNIPKVENL